MCATAFRIRKDDQVMVVSGKEKGKTGKVMSVNAIKNTVMIEKVNIVKKHQKPNQQQGQGGIVEKEASIHLSNVMVLCAKCGKPVRVGRKYLEDGVKVRFCKKCGEVIDK